MNLMLLQLSVVHEFNSWKHGLCWNVLAKTNGIVGVVSQTFLFLNYVRVTFLASVVFEYFAEK